MSRLLIFPTTLQTLPVELICYILGHLEMPDLLTCSTVTKNLRKAIMNSSRLQYTIELAKYRMVSLLPASASPPFATRLKLLRDRERAWKYINWKKRHTLKLPPTGSVYEFVGGLYGNGKEDDSQVTVSISFTELPSADAMLFDGLPRELQSWTHAMSDVTIVDFTMDPSQDLLVLVALAPPDSKYAYELHLRSIKTNRPHARASLPTLPCLLKQATPPQLLDILPNVRVQVAADLVALLIKEIHDSSSAHLEIWNWQNGPRFSCSMTKPNGMDDFTFLTHDSFLLVRPSGHFEVYTFVEPVRDSTVPTIRATYAFPTLSNGYMYYYISMSSNPAPGYVPRSRSDTDRNNLMSGGSKQIYYPDPDERIHACCLYIFNSAIEENQDHHDIHSFVFFLNIQTLLNPPAVWLVKKPSTHFYNGHSATTSIAKRFAASVGAIGTSSESTAHCSSSSSSLVDDPVASRNSSIFSSSLSNPIYPPFPTFNRFPAHTFTSSPIPPVNPTPSISSTSSSGSRTSIASLSPVVSIPWEVWGPQSTRWFEECINTDWQHAIYGLRTVESVGVPKRKDRNLITTSLSCPHTHPATGLSYKSVAVQATEGSSSSMTVDVREESATTDDLLPSTQEDSASTIESEESEDDEVTNAIPRERNLLRIRDFNPYSFKRVSEPFELQASNGKGKHKARWRAPRLVTESSKICVKGVFTRDIESSLPYMEVVSEDTFEVTDVMMDDCRLLLLNRGQGGKLKRIEVLMM